MTNTNTLSGTLTNESLRATDLNEFLKHHVRAPNTCPKQQPSHPLLLRCQALPLQIYQQRLKENMTQSVKCPSPLAAGRSGLEVRSGQVRSGATGIPHLREAKRDHTCFKGGKCKEVSILLLLPSPRYRCWAI